jgi:hypothetical protein
MAKKNQSDKPESEKKAAKKEAAAVVAAAQAAAPLKVEIHFPLIADLKQAIAFDADGNLVMAIQFKVRVDQYELFRLVNLLKQPHGSLYATIGSPQSAMDFKFSKEGKVEILKAEIAAEKPKALAAGEKGKPADAGTGEPLNPTDGEVTFKDISFNHIPEDERPFGVVIDFTNGATDKVHVVAGRGKSATEAVISGVKATSANLFGALEQPFEIVAAVKKTPETDAQIKIIRAIEVGSFDPGEDKGGANPKKGE